MNCDKDVVKWVAEAIAEFIGEAIGADCPADDETLMEYADAIVSHVLDKYGAI